MHDDYNLFDDKTRRCDKLLYRAGAVTFDHIFWVCGRKLKVGTITDGIRAKSLSTSNHHLACPMLQQVSVGMATMLVAPEPGTLVWLHSMAIIDDKLNGQTALVASNSASKHTAQHACGYCEVELLAGGSIMSLPLQNLSLSSPLFCIKKAACQNGLGMYAIRDIAAGESVQSQVTCVIRLVGNEADWMRNP